MEHYDVLIIGAGISGIGAAYHLQNGSPNKTYAVLEGRTSLGGTWDLFRYPGIRSDSDMHTLGYSFRPWQERKAIADGPAILNYLKETAHAYGIDKRIKYDHRVKTMRWDSGEARWGVEVATGKSNTVKNFSCNFLLMCTGYYSYDEGHDPHFEGRENFKGQVIHPQFWPKNLDYRDKKVVVIGSGATAITLVPAMAEKAGHVTMLQRSPTYIASLSSEDGAANFLHKWLPDALAHPLIKFKNLLFGFLFFMYSMWRPERVRQLLIGGVKRQLPEGFDVEKHFTPYYKPWDQRLCVAPDGDFFRTIRHGKSSVVTDHIERFTESGVKLKSGEEIDADIIVTATGLKMELMSGIDVQVDGRNIAWGDTVTYKGMMYSDVPNLVSFFGYTTASWTLKSDLIGEYVCRLLNFMDRKGYKIAVPHDDNIQLADEALNHLTSGYVQRARSQMPKQGAEMPWISSENYFADLFRMRFSAVADREMVFR